METYLNCKKIDTAISRVKKTLKSRVKTGGIYENFGQNEVSEIEDKFIDSSVYTQEMNLNRKKLQNFNLWCMDYNG